MSEFEIRYVGGHVEVYSRGGAFLFSADTVREAMEELGPDYDERDVRLVRIKFLCEVAN